MFIFTETIKLYTMSDEKSLFVKKVVKMEIDVFDPKSQKGKSKGFPFHMDRHMGTFGETDKTKFGGTIQGGLVGIVVNLNNGKVFRITPQQLVNYIAEAEGE